MEPKRIQIDLKGIQRNISPIGAPAGSCKDIVNLRPKDGGWRPVLPKSISVYSTSEDYIELYVHASLPEKQYLARYRDGYEEKIGHIENQGGSLVVIQELLTYNYFLTEFKSIAHINEVVVVSTTSETTYHMYKDGGYIINTSLSDLPDIRIAAGNYDQRKYDEPDNISESWPEALANYLEYMKEQTEEHKRYDGYIVLIAAYRMTDGTVIKYSSPVIHKAGAVDDDSEAVYMQRVFNEGMSGLVYKVEGVIVSKVRYYINETFSEDWKHVIESIDLYAARIPLVGEPDLQTDYQGFWAIFPTKNVDKEFSNITLHKIDSREVSAFAFGGNITVVMADTLDVSDIHVKEALVSDNLTNHQLGFAVNKTYNGRIHAANIRTILSPGYQLTIPHLAWQRDNNNYNIFKNLQQFDEGGVMTHFTVVDAEEEYHLVFRVWIDTHEGEREVAIKMPAGSKMFQLMNEQAPITNVILLNKLIAYPHPDARKFDITLYDSGAPDQVTLIYRGEFKKHKMYPFAYHLHTGGKYWEDDPTPVVKKATVITSSVTNISASGARSGGNVIDDGGASVTARGVVWAKTFNPTIEANEGYTSNGSGTGSYTSNLTTLDPDITYYVRAYATNTEGTAYGNQVSFKTYGDELPTVSTDSVTEITRTTAKSGGDVTDDGGLPVTAKGVIWKKNDYPTMDDYDGKTIDGYLTGVFISEMEGLDPDTSYFVCAYATNDAGTSLGDYMYFETSAVDYPDVDTLTVSEIEATTAKSGWNVTDDGGGDLLTTGLVWNKTGSPTVSSYEGKHQTPSPLPTGDHTMTDLTPGSTYYVRAFASNGRGVSYGNEREFQTT